LKEKNLSQNVTIV